MFSTNCHSTISFLHFSESVVVVVVVVVVVIVVVVVVVVTFAANDYAAKQRRDYDDEANRKINSSTTLRIEAQLEFQFFSRQTRVRGMSLKPNFEMCGKVNNGAILKFYGSWLGGH